MADQVLVEGLTEFRRALRDAQTGLPRALSEAHKKVAVTVVAAASPKLVTKTGKRAVSRISASGTQSGAFVRLRGATAFGDEFGGGKHGAGNPTARGGHTTQFRPYTKGGLAVYPTIRHLRKPIEAMYLDAVEQSVAKRAFPT